MTRLRPSLLCGFLLFLGVNRGCTPPTVPLEVEYAGCKEVLVPGTVCVLYPKRKLFLWFESPSEAQIEIRAGGERLKVVGDPVGQGQRYSLEIPSEAKRVEVLVESAGRYATWFLDLGPPSKASRDILREVNNVTLRAYKLLEDRQFLEVQRMLYRLGLPPKLPAESRYLLAFYRASLAERQGDYRSALVAIQEAVEVADRVLWNPQKKWMAEQQLALLWRGLGRSREAAELFERLGKTPEFADSCEEGQFLNNQAWSAVLAREAGESFADPAPLFDRSLAKYKTCKRFTPDKEFNLLINLALAHLQEKRRTKTQEFLARAQGLARNATVYQKLWWRDLEARTALLDRQPKEALRRFQVLEELALETKSPDGRLRAVFGKARSYEALGDLTAALKALESAEALLDEQSLQIPLYEGRETFMATRHSVVSLHIETLLRQGSNAEALAVARQARARMLRQLERSDRLASLTPKQRAEWDSLLAEYLAKRSALEERARGEMKLPHDQRPREKAAREAAAEAAQRILDRAFQILGDPGAKPEKKPQPPRPGELILAYYPLSHHWVGFAADSKAVHVQHRIELPPDILSDPESHFDELARRLLLPFQAQIERAKRIRILTSGLLQGVDFHGLPFQGDVLLARCPVTYGLDLPVPAGQPPGRRALLVANPSADLPGALKEARMVQDALRHQARPWIIEELKSTQASPLAVRDRIAAADLLHYAGHGVFSGPRGWESNLPLAEKTHLTLGELLTLQRVPAWVVLSGCDTGRSAETTVQSLGLAQAFLLAGSRTVIASTRPADDRTVPWFVSELYQQWDGEQDFAVALQRAQLSWRQRNRQADWASFRLFEP